MALSTTTPFVGATIYCSNQANGVEVFPGDQFINLPEGVCTGLQGQINPIHNYVRNSAQGSYFEETSPIYNYAQFDAISKQIYLHNEEGCTDTGFALTKQVEDSGCFTNKKEYYLTTLGGNCLSDVSQVFLKKGDPVTGQCAKLQKTAKEIDYATQMGKDSSSGYVTGEMAAEKKERRRLQKMGAKKAKARRRKLNKNKEDV